MWPPMNDSTCSPCVRQFGFPDLSPRPAAGKCPVLGCDSPATPWEGRAYCTEHGLRIHRNTFVYWNGFGQGERQATLRNLLIRPDLAESLVLNSTTKADTDRLHHECSEDALTWNVFVALASAGRLKDAVRFLVGIDLAAEPELYLWGTAIEPRNGCIGLYPPLTSVRDRLEPDIQRYQTEPDVMLVVPGELVVCVEAKFCSGNPIASDRVVGPGEKPVDRIGLVSRYLNRAGVRTKSAVCKEQVVGAFHSQLFRNVIFAAEMADGADWRVVNLVSSTQWAAAEDSSQYSFQDPTVQVRSYLSPELRDRFQFRTWERLHDEVIAGVSQMEEVDLYMRAKSAHLRQAFILRVSQP